MSPSSQIFPPAAMETHTLTLAGPEPSSVSLLQHPADAPVLIQAARILPKMTQTVS